jgi:two-component system chemotaxis response regulator CheB
MVPVSWRDDCSPSSPSHRAWCPRMSAYPIVALVCSVGGLDALTRVLAPLPADLPAAVIVLQHLSPEYHSELSALLDQRTALTVVAAADGAVLAPGLVVVAPSGRHTLVAADRTIALIPSGTAPPYRPSADLLLTTLAIAAGADAIAVVLSGRGNDAATGASAVHRFGGTVIASTALTSTQAAMPQATIDRPEAVDHVVPLDDIAELLTALTTAPLIRPAEAGPGASDAGASGGADLLA